MTKLSISLTAKAKGLGMLGNPSGTCMLGSERLGVAEIDCYICTSGSCSFVSGYASKLFAAPLAQTSSQGWRPEALLRDAALAIVLPASGRQP